MAVFVPVPGVVKASLEFTLLGQKCANVFHFDKGSAWDDGSMSTLAVTLAEWYTGAMIQWQPTNFYFNGVVITDLTTQNAPGIEIMQATPVAGDGGQLSLPGNVTFTAKWTTNLRGRSYRGRTYHVGLRAGLVEGNRLTNEAINHMTVAYSALLTDTAAEGFEMVVVSRFHNNAPRITGIFTPISGVVIEGNLDSQRRRLNTRGE